jgi:hypothetical protein
MNNWVMVLWVITAINQHDYQSSCADPAAAYTSKMGCEAALKKDPPQGRDAECTPFRANPHQHSLLLSWLHRRAIGRGHEGGWWPRTTAFGMHPRSRQKQKQGLGIDNPRWSKRAIRSF